MDSNYWVLQLIYLVMVTGVIEHSLVQSVK